MVAVVRRCSSSSLPGNDATLAAPRRQRTLIHTMVYLSIQTLKSARGFTNPCQKRELDLRDLSLDRLENLGLTLDQYDVIDIDGVRINFDNGWALIRASNPQPVLVLRFEAETQTRLKELVSIIKKKMDRYHPVVQFDYQA